MAQAIFTGKERVGRITLERFRGSLRLRSMINRKSYSLTIGKDSKDTLKAARATAQTIDSDITFSRFDSTLRKYGKTSTVLEVVSLIQTEQQIKLQELCSKFVNDKLTSIKPKTVEKYENFTKLFDKLGERLSYDSLATKGILL